MDELLSKPGILSPIEKGNDTPVDASTDVVIDFSKFIPSVLSSQDGGCREERPGSCLYCYQVVVVVVVVVELSVWT